ncbi:hypothetical protein SB18R_24440, partial [Pseudomonas oryzihabitans]
MAFKEIDPMFPLRPLAVLTLTLIAGTALAANSSATLQQDGNSGTLTLDQSGAGNSATLYQLQGESNQISVVQTGASTATITQGGDVYGYAQGNVASLRQEAGSSVHSLTQDGFGNQATVTSVGSNSGTLTQVASSAQLT